ncbi:MAG: NnrS family protein [Gammaproteobacteria bacterium]|nr:NnrS family protein [Gammaproteobacteria bacterium]
MPKPEHEPLGNSQLPQAGLPLWNLGFRPFFMGAAYFGALSVALWIYIYRSGAALYPQTVSPSLWHAHELLFGYVLAVIAGFLLTATKNWTGKQTLHRAPLAWLFFLWLAARLSLLVGAIPLAISAALDLAFIVWLFIAIAGPIIAARQKRQYAILGKLVFLLCCNALFYLDALGAINGVAYPAIYTTLYVVIGLILMMSRRLIPFFVEAGVGYKIQLRNSTTVDLASLFVFLGFFLCEVFFPSSGYQYFFAGLLVPILSIRAWWWYTPGVLKKPLLISLYLAYLGIVFGFVLFALVPLTAITPLLAVHMLTIGGIGLVTVSMMARVSWGHSGRNIQEPPKILGWIFTGLLLAALTRVLAPLFSKLSYPEWVVFSASLWVVSLLCFALVYTPIWLRQRIDRQYG